MNDMFGTVAAVSTPRAAGGISVIRISGDNALAAADMLFKPISTVKMPSEMNGYTCAYGFFIDGNGEKIDDGILTVFRAPKSYTGEDVAELSCHGGVFITNMLIRRVYECSVQPAAPGEFTKRAYLNGKLSLTQAEAVSDVISAESKQSCRCANQIKDGMLFRQIDELSKRLLKLLGELGAWIDYPDEDIPEVNEDNMLRELQEISGRLKKISSTYDTGRILKEGVRTAIAGKPNVGKSSLMNLLSGCERSIVTDIAGTTRDIVEESIRLGDIVLRLSDTAGVRKTDDIVEEAGIKRAYERIIDSELIIAVFDNSSSLDSDDLLLIEKCRQLSQEGIKLTACINKSDLHGCLSEKDRKIISDVFGRVVEISAKNGEGIDILQKVLYDIFIDDSIISDNTAVIANERQKRCIDNAAARIDEAIFAVRSGVTLDAVNVILDEAENALLELNGQKTTEEVVNEVFSHFCVGK